MSDEEIKAKILALLDDGWSVTYSFGQLGMKRRKMEIFRRKHPEFSTMLNQRAKKKSTFRASLSLYKKEGAD